MCEPPARYLVVVLFYGKPDFEVAELLHTSWLTVLRTRHRFVEGGLDFALNELPRAGRLPKIDDKIETILTTLAQSQPPNGRVRWTLQLLADRLVALTRLDSLSYEAVRLVLKKTMIDHSSPTSASPARREPRTETNTKTKTTRTLNARPRGAERRVGVQAVVGWPTEWKTTMRGWPPLDPSPRRDGRHEPLPVPRTDELDDPPAC